MTVTTLADLDALTPMDMVDLVTGVRSTPPAWWAELRGPADDCWALPA